MRWRAEKRDLERNVYEVRKSFKNMDWADFRARITQKMETEKECTKQIVLKTANMMELSEEVRGLMKRRRSAITEKRRKNISEEWREIMKEVIKETNKNIKLEIKKQQEEEFEKKIKAISTKGEI